jgi:hypothetical protein
MKTAQTDKRSQKPAGKSTQTTSAKPVSKKTTSNTPESNLNQMNIEPNPRANEDASLQENSNSDSIQNARKGNM